MKRTKTTTKILFLIYAAVLVWVVMFKMAHSMTDLSWLEGVRAINTEPFRYSIIGGRYPTTDTVLNVLIFLPLGVYLSMLEIPAHRAVLYGVVVSLGFEVCQYALAIGVADVTDLITNTAGTLLGVVLYTVARLLCTHKQKRDTAINGVAVVALAVFIAYAVWLFYPTAEPYK